MKSTNSCHNVTLRANDRLRILVTGNEQICHEIYFVSSHMWIKNMNGCELDDYSSFHWTEIFLFSLLRWDHARGSSGFISSGYCEFWFERESRWVWSSYYTPSSTTVKRAVRLFTITLLSCITHPYINYLLTYGLKMKAYHVNSNLTYAVPSNIHDKTHVAEKRTQKVTRKTRVYFYDL